MTKIPQSNYTQVPNVFFDEILESLKLAETRKTIYKNYS
jgi:hypothetical protein